MRIDASVGSSAVVSISLGPDVPYNAELVESLAFRAARTAAYLQSLYDSVLVEPAVVGVGVCLDPLVDYEPLDEDEDELSECCEEGCDDCPFLEESLGDDDEDCG